LEHDHARLTPLAASTHRKHLDRRIPDRVTLEQGVAAWETARNALGGKVDWRFRTEDARIKLKRLYPSIDV